LSSEEGSVEQTSETEKQNLEDSEKLDSANHDSAHPDYSHPKSAHPDSAHPDSSHLDSSHSASSHPDFTHPNLVENACTIESFKVSGSVNVDAIMEEVEEVGSAVLGEIIEADSRLDGKGEGEVIEADLMLEKKEEGEVIEACSMVGENNDIVAAASVSPPASDLESYRITITEMPRTSDITKQPPSSTLLEGKCLKDVHEDCKENIEELVLGDDDLGRMVGEGGEKGRDTMVDAFMMECEKESSIKITDKEVRVLFLSI